MRGLGCARRCEGKLERKEMSQEKEVFGLAVEIADPEARAAFIHDSCGGDEWLERRVLALVSAHGAPSSFLSGKPALARANPEAGLAGQMVGRYRLLEPIGEGGFGVVYLAEQLEPVRRQVALKVIKPGMDSKQVIGRFEAERQALALMDHPGIAKIFDAGMTELGLPYFVMELVRGVSITKFCDEQALGLEARLELFIEVCLAVQHAHQKGVIHRDIKPSNILVALSGERPPPKVIDFGVAKATREQLTDRTAVTMFQQFLGTPAYMSPEQAALGELDVDTRSDIYSLGALLYELLTGGPPFGSAELLSGGIDEMRRMIREREPEWPSARRRRLAPKEPDAPPSPRLRQFAHELDLVVMKALAKDRDRRYATASGLAEDLGRFLNHESVTAVAPTLAYRVSKFCRRNRAAIVAAAAFAALLLTGVVASVHQAVRAHRAETLALTEAASAQSVSEFLWKELLKPLTPWQHTNPVISLRGAFDMASANIEARLATRPLAEASIRLSFGRSYTGLSEFAAAETNLLRALELRRAHLGPLDERTAEALHQLAILREFQLRPLEAAALFEEAASIRARLFGPEDRDSTVAAAKAALIRAGLLPDAAAEPILLQTLDNLRRVAGGGHHVTRGALNALGMLRLKGGKFGEAFEIFDEARRLAVAEDGAASSGALNGLGLMALSRARQGRFAEADQSFQGLFLLLERHNPANHVLTWVARLTYVDNVLVPQGRFGEAAHLLLRAAKVVAETKPELRPVLDQSLGGLLAAWRAKGAGLEFEEFQRQSGMEPASASPPATGQAPPR